MLNHRPDQGSSVGAQRSTDPLAVPGKRTLIEPTGVTGPGQAPNQTAKQTTTTAAQPPVQEAKPLPRLDLRPTPSKAGASETSAGGSTTEAASANAAIARAERKLSQPGYRYVEPFAHPVIAELRKGTGNQTEISRLDRMFEVSKTDGGGDLAAVKAASNAYHAELGHRAVDDLTAASRSAPPNAPEALLTQLRAFAESVAAAYKLKLEDDVQMYVEIHSPPGAGPLTNVPAIPAQVSIAPNDWCIDLFACLTQVRNLLIGAFRRTMGMSETPADDVEAATDESTDTATETTPLRSSQPAPYHGMSAALPSSSQSPRPDNGNAAAIEPADPAQATDPYSAYAEDLRAARLALRADPAGARTRLAALLERLGAPQAATAPSMAISDGLAPEHKLRVKLTKKHERFLETLLDNLVAPIQVVKDAIRAVAAQPRSKAKNPATSTSTAQPRAVSQGLVDEVVAAFSAAKRELPSGYLPAYIAELHQQAEEAVGAAEASRPSPLVGDERFQRLYGDLATARYQVVHKGDKDSSGKSDPYKNYRPLLQPGAAQSEPGGASESTSAAPAQSAAGEDAERKLKIHVLEHLQVKITAEALAQPLDKLLEDHIRNRSARITELFRADRELAQQCAARVKNTELHPLLVGMLQTGEPHSIHDINDYVGDKLSEPLMRWIVQRGIAVEVHATSVLASTAKLASEGFTDLFDLPSSHTATKKLIAYNPRTSKIKVVIQSLPGTSYAVQTSGQFLFYALYDFDMALAESIPVPKEPFKPSGYRAQKLIDQTGDTARYLLVPDAPHASAASGSPGTSGAAKPATRVAEVPCAAGKAWQIRDDGALVVPEGMTGQIKIVDAKIERMNPAQLNVFEENVDYVKLYTDCLHSYGVATADIAVIGARAALQQELGIPRGDNRPQAIRPTASIDLPYFNASVFHLNDKVVLAFTISPHFFGDRAGFLVTALRQLGVQHVLFTGTAGGLETDAAVGDLVFPKSFNDAADGTNKPVPGVENKAREVGEALRSEDSQVVAPGRQGAPDQIKSASHVKLGQQHAGVHAPITESAEMITRLRREGVSSVDCEAGFIAHAIKDSDMSLYHFVRLSDVPDTQHSIGMGGMASDHATEQDTVPRINQLDVVLEILKKLLGIQITQSQKSVEGDDYAIGVGGEIRGLQLPHAPSTSEPTSSGGAEGLGSEDSALHDASEATPSLTTTSGPTADSSSGARTSTSSTKSKTEPPKAKQPEAPVTEQSITASFRVLLAPVGEGHKQDTAAILALFSRKVSVVFAASGGVVTPSAMARVNELVQEFYSVHKIKIEVDYKRSS